LRHFNEGNCSDPLTIPTLGGKYYIEAQKSPQYSWLNYEYQVESHGGRMEMFNIINWAIAR
jgi:hypothetical protein